MSKSIYKSIIGEDFDARPVGWSSQEAKQQMNNDVSKMS